MGRRCWNIYYENYGRHLFDVIDPAASRPSRSTGKLRALEGNPNAEGITRSWIAFGITEGITLHTITFGDGDYRLRVILGAIPFGEPWNVVELAR